MPRTRKKNRTIPVIIVLFLIVGIPLQADNKENAEWLYAQAGVNVREGFGLSHPVVFKIEKGQKVKVETNKSFAADGYDWVRVITDEGLSGWSVKKFFGEEKIVGGVVLVDRVWSSHDYGYALVTFKNQTSKTYNRVTIRCTALGESGKKLGINSRSFFSHERGLIEPGFEGTVEVPVALHGADLKSMSCEADGQ